MTSRIIIPKDSCLILQPRIAKSLGKSAALLLQQIHYWITSGNKTGKIVDGKKWIYNSFKDWTTHLQTMSESTVKRAVVKLRDLGLIETRNLNTNKAVHTNWYTIHYDRLQTFLKALKHEGKSVQIKMNHSLVQIDPNIPDITSNTSLSNKSEERDKKKMKENKILKNLIQTTLIDQNTNSKEALSQDMLQIWNTTVGKETIQATMTKDRARYLIAAFKYKFQSNLDQFKAYCRKIASSDFLMGRVTASFKATLDWVLKFSTIQRIAEGQFGVKNVLHVAHHAEAEAQAEQVIRNKGYSLTIETLHLALLKGLGVVRYQSWIPFVKGVLFQDGKTIFVVTSRFAKDWMELNLRPEMERVLNGKIDLKFY